MAYYPVIEHQQKVVGSILHELYLSFLNIQQYIITNTKSISFRQVLYKKKIIVRKYYI